MQAQVIAEFATTEILHSIRIGNEHNTNPVSMLTYSDGQIGFFKPGISGLKEILAYKIGKLLGLAENHNSLLSTTVLCNYKNYGSIMQKAPGIIDFSHNLSNYDNYKNFYEMMIFDFIIANDDRNSENYSIDYENVSIHAIDHSEAFDYRNHVYNQYIDSNEWEFSDIKIPLSIKLSLKKNCNEVFIRILNEVLFNQDVLYKQNFKHISDG